MKLSRTFCKILSVLLESSLLRVAGIVTGVVSELPVLRSEQGELMLELVGEQIPSVNLSISCTDRASSP